MSCASRPWAIEVASSLLFLVSIPAGVPLLLFVPLAPFAWLLGGMEWVGELAGDLFVGVHPICWMALGASVTLDFCWSSGDRDDETRQAD